MIHTVIAICTASLYRMGGSDYFPKAFRRFGVPVTILVWLLYTDIHWFQSVMVCAGLCGVLHLGYGEGRPWWARFIIMTSYIIPSILLGYTHMQWITPCVTWSLFYLSQQPKTSKYFVWEIVEISTGAMIGLTYVSAVL